MGYVVVEWTDSGVSVINSTWLTPLKKEAFWPTCKEQKNLNKILKESDPVINESWVLHSIKRCMYETDDLEKALKKCKDAEDTSNLDSEADTLSRTRRRIKARKRYGSESDDSNVSEQPPTKSRHLSLERPPRLSCSVSNTLHSTVSSYTQAIPGTSSHSINISTASEQSITNSSLISEIDTPAINRSTSNSHSLVEPRNNIAGQDLKVLQLLYHIREQNDQILNHLNSKAEILSWPGNVPVDIPCKNKDQLIELDAYLKTKEHSTEMISYLSSLGGKDCTSKTNRILKHLMTDELAALYNYRGKRSKLPFCELTLNDIIIQSVKQTTNSTNTAVEGVIKVWLKHAPQRFAKTKKLPNP